MAVTENYVQYVLEQLAGKRRLDWRRMFSAVGIYCKDLFFGLLSNDSHYLKMDGSRCNLHTAPETSAHGFESAVSDR